MKKLSIVSICIVTIMALVIWASDASAYGTYSSCSQCHGDFRAAPYRSLADGQTWASGLHDTHRNMMLNGDCNTCHYGSSRRPVYTYMSNGGTGFPGLGCVGCHGRAEDNSGSATIGAGLRQHHFEAGETVCLGCHYDADPGNYTPVGENVPPPYYFTPDSNHPNKPTDSCNQNGKENFAGTAIGLDNDGDGLYDANDPDCQTSVACIDNDGDGYGSNGASTCTNGTAVDCNDNDAAINPGAVEVCDGIDNDCNGQIDEGVMNTYYRDNDGDGYGTTSPTVQGCSQPAGYAPNDTDCNDNDAQEHPNQTWYQDADGDGYSSGNMIVQCARPAGYKTASELQATSGDCNDNDPAVKPGAAEVCDGIDNDCNGQTDEGISSTPTTCGVGACASTGLSQCINGNMVDSCTPKAAQTEGPFGDQTCSDSIDNDCDGLTDASDSNCISGCIDNDGDGYGSNGDPSCPNGTAVDCNDSNASINPGAGDASCNGVDDNCNGTADEGYVPSDTTCGVGICSSTGQLTCQSGQIVDTCTPNAAQTEGPSGSATCSDALDNDCDGLSDSADPGCAASVCIDNDGDGYGSNGDPSCPNGTAVDCNDSNASINPGAGDASCNGVDDNCNGTADEGYVPSDTTCGVGVCSSTGQLTCQSGQIVDTCTPNAAQTEGPSGSATCSDALDNDCDGLSDSADPGCAGSVCIDNDGDGYGSNGDPSCPNGTAIDCNDRRASINPGADEVCDGKDNNCDGQIDEGVLKTFYKDADRDGYGDPSEPKQSCKRPRRYVKDNTDCDDSHRNIHPNAEERCNGKDNNCNGQIDEGVLKTFYMDADGDGYGDPSVSTQSCRVPEGYVKNNTDCSDTNPSLHEGMNGTCSSQGDHSGDEGEDVE